MLINMLSKYTYNSYYFIASQIDQFSVILSNEDWEFKFE